jgi:hypothetical protein
MAIDFPSPASNGQTFTASGVTWQYNNGKWTANTGSVTGSLTGVTAGTGLTGGGTSGNVTLNLAVPVTIANGGTGATTAPAAVTALGAAPLVSPTFTGTLTLNRSAFVVPATSNITGAVTISWANGEVQKYTLTGNVTLSFSSWPASGNLGKIVLDLTQGGTGTYGITWPTSASGFKWPGGTVPTMTTGVGARDLYLFTTNDGGTSVLASVIGQNYS